MILKYVCILFLTLFSFILDGCKKSQYNAYIEENNANNPKSKENIVMSQTEELKVLNFSYDFNHPSRSLILPRELNEISGLSYANNRLYAVNDELGKFYAIDPATGKVLQSQTVISKGDYEGIEWKNDELYILKSSGTLYQIVNGEFNEKFNTLLTQSNDAEGLALDHKTDRLVIACKGRSSLSKYDNKKTQKAFFSFDLANKQLDTLPIIISDDMLLEFYNSEWRKNKRLSETQDKKYEQRLKDFSPSGIAIHPESGEWFVLSSVGKTLIQLKSDLIVSIHFLDKGIHSQPEGICFGDNNTLYISNEAKSLIAKIHVFEDF